MTRGTPPPPTVARLALGLAFVWVALFGIYVLFVGSLSVNEALAGGGSVTFACLWWARSGRITGKHFNGWLMALRPLGGALAGLPGGTAKVAGQLAAVAFHGGPQGGVAYRRGADNGWASSDWPAERAYGLIATSLSPDSYIVRDDEGDRGILDHALDRDGGRR